MTARTGLGPVEVALLDALDLLVGNGAERVRCSDALAVVDRLHGVGPRYSWPVLVDLAVPWRLHLPLVDGHGNLGTQGGDGPADAQYVEARLSEVGALALAAERAEIGPVPLGLIEGSLYRGGPVPPLAPDAVVGTLLAAGTDAGPPVLPTGGTVGGDLAGLLAGRPVRLTLGCTIRPLGGDLVITEVPLGVDADRVVENIHNRSRERATPRGGGPVRPSGCPVTGVYDETSSRNGLLIRVVLDPGSDLRAAVEWLRDVWPVTVLADCRLPAPQAERLAAWDRGDGSGLRALADLLAPRLFD
jgi:hypothetical protein